ncbi:MAG: pilus assembly protein [Oligoflexia bacterium]|nr:pilus assembly protein [Oligoflexia bacterium]
MYKLLNSHGPVKEQGAALLEFALVVPFLTLIFFGIVELGRTLIQGTWVSQAAFEAALLGGETPHAVAIPVMNQRVETLSGIQGQQLVTELGFNASYDATSNRTVQVDLNGEVARLLKSPYPLKMNIGFTGPVLLSYSTLPLALSSASNPACQYACDGTQCCGVACPAAPSCVGQASPMPFSTQLGEGPGGGGGGEDIDWGLIIPVRRGLGKYNARR